MSSSTKHCLEEQLIMEVEAHMEIYDKSHPGFKIRGNVEKAWQEIALIMEEDGNFEVKCHWKV